MKSKGSVVFAAHLEEDGTYRPVLQLKNFGPNDETVEFIGNFTVADDGMAQDIANEMLRIFMGPKEILRKRQEVN